MNTAAPRRLTARRATKAAALLAAACLPHFAPKTAYAQSNTWTAGGSGTWSTAANWALNSAPAAGGSATTQLQFNAKLTDIYTATNDLGNPFLLNGMFFNSTSSSAITIASAVSNTLQFTGTNPFITQSNFGAVIVSSSFNLNPTSGNVTINGSGLGAATFSGIISESGGARQLFINKPAPTFNAGTIVLSGANTFTGGVTLTDGVLSLVTSASALGTGTFTNAGGAVAHSLTIANNVDLSSTLTYISGTGTFSGVVKSLTSTAGVAIRGAASLNFSGANTYTGPTTLNPSAVPASTGVGTMNLVGAAGAIASSSEYIINSGMTLNLDNSVTNNNDRLSNGTITLRSGNVRLGGLASATTTENVGSIVLAGGYNFISINAPTGATPILAGQFDMTRSNNATVLIRGSNLGTAATAVAKFTLATAPSGADFVGGGSTAPGTTNISIVPWAIGDTSATGTGDSFVTYGTNGFRKLNTSATVGTGEYATTLASGANDQINYRLTSTSATALSGATTINSLFLAGTGGLNGTGALTLTSGALATTSAATIANPLAFGSREANIYAIGVALTLNGEISGSGGVTKSGTGTVVFGGTNIYTGVTTINAGTVSVPNTTTAFGNTSGFVIGSQQSTHTSIAYSGSTNASITQNIDIRAGYFEPVLTGTATSLTLDGIISGPGGVFWSQSSKNLVLNGVNTYTGPTRIFNGNFVINGDSAFGNGGPISFNVVSTSGLIMNGAWTTSRHIDFDGGSTLVNTNAFDATWNGPVTGSGSLLKSGAGKLTLTANAPFTGSATINAGTFTVNGQLGPSASIVTINAPAALSGTGSIFRSVTLAAGAAVLAPGDNSAATLRLNALTLNSGNNLIFDVGTNTDLVNIDGAITLPSSGAYTLTLDNTTGFAAGNFLLFNYGSRVNTTNPFSVLGIPAGFSASFTFGLTQGILNVTQQTSASGNRINNGAPENVPTNAAFTTTTATTFVGNAATIDSLIVANTTPTVSLDAATATGSLNLASAAITVNSGGGVVFDSGAGSASINFGALANVIANSNVTFNLPLAGTNGINLSGTNPVTFGAANTLTGALSVANTLNLSNSAVNTFTTVAGAGNVVINTGATLNVTGGTQVIPTVLSGAGNFTYAGTGTASVTATNSIGGAVTISSGTLELGSSTALGTTGTGPITNNSNLSLKRTGAYTVANDIGGSGAVTQNLLSSTVTLTGNNTYLGVTRLNVGTVIAGSNTAIPSTSVLTFTNGTGSTNFVVSNGITATVGGINLPSPYFGSSPAGANITTGTGVLNLFGDLLMPATTGWPLTLAGNINLGSALRTFNIADNTNSLQDVQSTAAISGAAGFTKIGTGGIILGGNSSYTGVTNINQGIVWLRDANGAGGSQINVGDTTGTNTAELNLILTNTTVANAINVRAGSTGGAFIDMGLSSGVGTFSGPVTLNKNVTYGAGNLATLHYSGVTSGGFAVTVSNFGTTLGTTVMRGQSTYSAGTTFSAGSLMFGSSNTMAGTVIVDGPIGTGALTNTVSTTSIGAVDAARTVNNNIVLTAGTNFIGTQDLTLGGSISGAGATGITKTGVSILSLGGINTYTGTTTVNGGTLRVNGTHTGGDSYTVGAAGSLGGTGVVTLASNKSVTINGNVAPGASPGVLTLSTSGTGATVLAPAGSYSWEINSQAGPAGVTWDKLAMDAVSVTATSTVGQQFTIKIVSLNGSNQPGPTPGWLPGSLNNPKVFTIATSSNNSFIGVDLSKFAIDTSQFQDAFPNSWSLSIGNSGGSLDLVYVPEPSSVTVGLVVAGGAMLRRRRRAARA